MTITPELLRQKIKSLDLTYTHVWEAVGLNRGWFCKMIMENSKYSFENPNPEWMKLILKYLGAYEKYLEAANKAHDRFLVGWDK